MFSSFHERFYIIVPTTIRNVFDYLRLPITVQSLTILFNVELPIVIGFERIRSLNTFTRWSQHVVGARATSCMEKKGPEKRGAKKTNQKAMRRLNKQWKRPTVVGCSSLISTFLTLMDRIYFNPPSSKFQPPHSPRTGESLHFSELASKYLDLVTRLEPFN